MSATTLLQILRAHRLDDDLLYTLAENALARRGGNATAAIDAVWQATAAQRAACAAELYGRVDGALVGFLRAQVRERKAFIEEFGEEEGGGVPLLVAYIIIARMLEEAAARGRAPPPLQPAGMAHPMLRDWQHQHF